MYLFQKAIKNDRNYKKELIKTVKKHRTIRHSEQIVRQSDVRWCGRTVNKIIIYLLPDLHFISRIYKSLHLKPRQVFLLQYIYLK